MTKKALRWVSGLAALAVLLITAVIVVNGIDEPLDAAAAAMGEPRVAGVRDDQNGYLAMLGMGAGDGADSAAYAQAWLAEARAASRDHRAENPVAAKRAPRPALCDPAQTACLAMAQEKAAAINTQLIDYKEDISRYDKLLAAPAYAEILDYRFNVDSQFPRYAPMGAAQRAWLTRAVLAVQAGDIDAALTAVERDLAFHRIMLQGSRTLVGKMVAVANTTRALAFVADVLQTSLIDLKPHAPRLTAMLQPLDPAVLNLDAPIEAEFGAIKQLLKDPAAANRTMQDGQSAPASLEEAIGLRFFYKPRATINAAHAFYGQKRDLLRKPPAQLLQARAAENAASSAMPWWDYFNNPVGKAMVRVALPSFASYALRLHDLDALNRVLGLGAEIIAADVSAEHISEFVAKAAPRFYDPYTGKPMQWDAAAKRLSSSVSDGETQQGSRKLFNVENGRVFLRL